MQAIRQYAIVHNNTLIVHLPDEMNEQEVEVIVLPRNENEHTSSSLKIKLSSLKGSMSPESETKIDSQLKSIRDEWENRTF